ncbi:MAG: phosphoribosylanthranilate isomerase [Chloroflexota bacterium]
MTRVKICGLRRPEDVVAAVDAGADFVGFVFAPSRRQVAPNCVRDMTSTLREHSHAQSVGVFVNAEPAEMNRLTRDCSLDYVQLSGDESEDVVRALDVPAIQVFHVGDHSDPEVLADRVAGTSAELVLLDTSRPGAFGGTGTAFDWSRVPITDRPILLAGGLHAGNAGTAVAAVHPWGVDVSSGVETDGEKDYTKMRAFVAAVRGNRV